MILFKIESEKNQLSESESQWFSDIIQAEKEEENDSRASQSYHDSSEFCMKHQMT